MEMIKDPASTKYGHMYEKKAIEAWVDKNGTCPMTNQPLTKADIYPMYSLKSTIEEMRNMEKENEANKKRIAELEALAAASQQS